MVSCNINKRTHRRYIMQQPSLINMVYMYTVQITVLLDSCLRSACSMHHSLKSLESERESYFRLQRSAHATYILKTFRPLKSNGSCLSIAIHVILCPKAHHMAHNSVSIIFFNHFPPCIPSLISVFSSCDGLEGFSLSIFCLNLCMLHRFVRAHCVLRIS